MEMPVGPGSRSGGIKAGELLPSLSGALGVGVDEREAAGEGLAGLVRVPGGQ